MATDSSSDEVDVLSANDQVKPAAFENSSQISGKNLKEMLLDDNEVDVVNTEHVQSKERTNLGARERASESPRPGPSGINQASEDEDVQIDSDDSVEIIEVPKRPVPLIVVSDSSSASEVDIIEIDKKPRKSKVAKTKPKTIKEKLEEQKNKIFVVKAEVKNGEESSPSKHDITCSICLGTYDNRAFLDECFHSFCYTCILQWAKVVKTCPLCKSPFKSIIYDIKPDLQYKQDFMNKSGNPTTEATSAITDDSWMEASQRFRYRTTLTAVGNYVSDWYRQRRYESFTRSPLWSRRRQRRPRNRWGHSQPSTWSHMIASEERRKSVYRSGMVIKEIKHPPGRVKYRDISVQFFQENPAITHRLVPWILRDLKIILDNNSSDTSFVLHLIMSLLQRYPMESDEFYNQLQPYLYNNTRQFIRELISFASSPYDMQTYDSRVVYDVPSAIQAAVTATISQPFSMSQSHLEVETETEVSFRDRLLDEVFEEGRSAVSPPLHSINSQQGGGTLEDQGWSSSDSVIDVTGPFVHKPPREHSRGKRPQKRGDFVYVGRREGEDVLSDVDLSVARTAGRHTYFNSDSSSESVKQSDQRRKRRNYTSEESTRNKTQSSRFRESSENNVSLSRERNREERHRNRQSNCDISPEIVFRNSRPLSENDRNSSSVGGSSSIKRTSRSRSPTHRLMSVLGYSRQDSGNSGVADTMPLIRETSCSKSRDKSKYESASKDRKRFNRSQYSRSRSSDDSEDSRSTHKRPGDFYRTRRSRSKSTEIYKRGAVSSSRSKERKREYSSRRSRSRSRDSSKYYNLSEYKPKDRKTSPQRNKSRSRSRESNRLSKLHKSKSKQSMISLESRRSRSRSRASSQFSKLSESRPKNDGKRHRVRSRSRSREFNNLTHHSHSRLIEIKEKHNETRFRESGHQFKPLESSSRGSDRRHRSRLSRSRSRESQKHLKKNSNRKRSNIHSDSRPMSLSIDNEKEERHSKDCGLKDLKERDFSKDRYEELASDKKGNRTNKNRITVNYTHCFPDYLSEKNVLKSSARSVGQSEVHEIEDRHGTGSVDAGWIENGNGSGDGKQTGNGSVAEKQTGNGNESRESDEKECGNAKENGSSKEAGEGIQKNGISSCRIGGENSPEYNPVENSSQVKSKVVKIKRRVYYQTLKDGKRSRTIATDNDMEQVRNSVINEDRQEMEDYQKKDGHNEPLRLFRGEKSDGLATGAGEFKRMGYDLSLSEDDQGTVGNRYVTVDTLSHHIAVSEGSGDVRLFEYKNTPTVSTCILTNSTVSLSKNDAILSQTLPNNESLTAGTSVLSENISVDSTKNDGVVSSAADGQMNSNTKERITSLDDNEIEANIRELDHKISLSNETLKVFSDL